jgi:endonuclease III
MQVVDIPFVNRKLKEHYEQAQHAPVIEFMRVQSGTPFRILVATVLSARTKDETTTVVVKRLFSHIRTPDDLANAPEELIAEWIFPVGFYRTKAKHLKALAQALLVQYNGEVPRDIEKLCTLPGVGRKTANLVMTAAFDDYGICVDIHVHRICNRLGLVETRTPHETEMKLRACLPRRFWKGWNRYVVAFGQTLCKPRKPDCHICPIRNVCEQRGV